MPIILVLCLFLGVAVAQWDANTLDNRQVMVHLFEWKWKDIAKECENWLGPNGFAGVQVSPPSENIRINGRPWYERYQPIGYGLNTRSGNEAEFKDMVNRCYKAGVRIYVDAVINHMAASNPDGNGAYDFWRVPYSSSDFNGPQNKCPTPSGIDYSNKYSIRNCDLVGLKDLDQGRNWVRDKIAEFLNNLIDMGVAGFRIDAAKHMWPGDLKAIYGRLKNLNTKFGFPSNARPFFFQEVIDQGGEPVTADEYLNTGRVTEFKYGLELARGFHRQNLLKWFKNFGEAWGFVPDYNSLVFIDNHDNQRGHGGAGSIITHQSPRLYKMANAFMLAYPYGFTRVMSSFSFSDPNSSPPQDSSGNIISPIFYSDNTCGNGWVCEHRWRQIKNMVDFRRVTVGQSLKNWWDNGSYQIAFGRGNKGFIAINNEDFQLSQTLQTGLPSGTYCNIILGDFKNGKCTGPTVYVNGSGYAKFNIAGSGNDDPVVAIHVNAKQ
ncbi:alpha-amylase A-like [Acanthaster planci]|uniref:Alpha-amylase n=1 Tax=Acanthaster planci TaxID=133434 RepID=A0A8B7ZKI4_ACAPL|nr:alpha-amylase A-like [Acanthaster planci]